MPTIQGHSKGENRRFPGYGLQRHQRARERQRRKDSTRSARRLERLGYKLNAKAKSLRQGRDRSIALLLPTMEHRQYSAMYEVFQRECFGCRVRRAALLTGFMEATEVAMLAAAINSRVSAIVTSSCLTDAVSRYREEAPEAAARVSACL